MAEEFDIVRAQNLPAATSVSDNDMLLVVQGGTLKRVIPSLMKGRPGDPGLTPYLGVTDTYIRWRQGASGTWMDLISLEKIRGPRGEKPLFRKLNGTLQMKYEGEPDSAYKNIFDREELKLKFSELTPAEVDLLRLHFSDLTDANKAELMKPATDAAADARKEITNMRQLEATVEEQEEARENFYSQVQAKEQARQNDEIKRQEAAAAQAEAERLRELKETERNATFDVKVREATDAAAEAKTQGDYAKEEVEKAAQYDNRISLLETGKANGLLVEWRPALSYI